MASKEALKLTIILENKRKDKWMITHKESGISVCGSARLLKAVARLCEDTGLWHGTKKPKKGK